MGEVTYVVLLSGPQGNLRSSCLMLLDDEGEMDHVVAMFVSRAEAERFGRWLLTMTKGNSAAGELPSWPEGKRTICGSCPQCGKALDVRWDPATPIETITDDDVRGWCLCPITEAEAQVAVMKERNWQWTEPSAADKGGYANEDDY